MLAVATTPWVGCFFTVAMKNPALMMPECDACETYAVAVARMEERPKMISGLGGPQAARDPLRTADRGYIQ
jgi:hypothetical protein